MSGDFSEHTVRLVADRLIREAMEAGKFDNLEGMGQPVAGMNEPLGHEHWLKRWAHQQRITALMTLRRDGEAGTVDAQPALDK